MEKFIEWLNVTRGNENNAYDCTSDLFQTKNIAKKNFLVLFSGVFCVYELKIISERGKTCTKEVETDCVKGKHTMTAKSDYIQQRS